MPQAAFLDLGNLLSFFRLSSSSYLNHGWLMGKVLGMSFSQNSGVPPQGGGIAEVIIDSGWEFPGHPFPLALAIFLSANVSLPRLGDKPWGFASP